MATEIMYNLHMIKTALIKLFRPAQMRAFNNNLAKTTGNYINIINLKQSRGNRSQVQAKTFLNWW